MAHRQDRSRTLRPEQSSQRNSAAFSPLRAQTAAPGLARSRVLLAHDFGRIPTHPPDRVIKEELEADRVAGLTTALPARAPFAGTFQIQPSSEAPGRGWDVAPPSVEKTLARAGRPLEAGLQQDMEKRFGFDFSRVRVYSDLEAAQSAQDVNASLTR